VGLRSNCDPFATQFLHFSTQGAESAAPTSADDIVAELPAIALTLQLAAITTLLLLALGTPIAWWLATTRNRTKPVVEALTAMPLVLPPSVLGFYFLVLLSPSSPLGAFWVSLTGSSLTFSFAGLVIASIFYSLPFMVQPLQSAFEAVGKRPLETAASLNASPVDAFFSVVVPLSTRGFLTAVVLTFAHTIGEFGVVLMVGGNITGKTRVISIAIYEHVETLNYVQAHQLAAGMLAFSFLVLLGVYAANKRIPVRVA
jgi:molybdate transport system permease protein